MSEGRELIAMAADAVERIRTMGCADGPFLESVIAAVLGETARNRFKAAAQLAALTAEYGEARAAVAALAADVRWHVRRRAMRCLGHDAPRSFAAEILRAGLTDTDRGVRLKATEVAGFLRLTNLVDAVPRA
jgi:hypothetical protein